MKKKKSPKSQFFDPDEVYRRKVRKEFFNRIDSIELRTKRSTSIYEDGDCYCCHYNFTKLHKFTKTSVGDIFVCKKCQLLLIERNFGKTDVMDIAYQGGGFSPK